MHSLETLKPMATAPKTATPDRLLVVDESLEGGMMLVRTWRLVHWLDAFGGRAAGWYGHDCGDLRHPVGWACVLRGGSALMPAATTESRGTPD